MFTNLRSKIKKKTFYALHYGSQPQSQLKITPYFTHRQRVFLYSYVLSSCRFFMMIFKLEDEK